MSRAHTSSDDLIDHMQKTRQTLSVARNAFEQARSKAWANDARTTKRKNELEIAEQAHLDWRMAENLGDLLEASPPDMGVLINLRADVQIAPELTRQFNAKMEAAERVCIKAETAYKSSVSEYLKVNALAPALDEVAEAFDALATASVKLMAASRITYRKFNTRGPDPVSHADLYGPMALLLHQMRELKFENYPYSVRPAWLPAHGNWFAGEMTGVAEEEARLLADIESEASA